MFMPRKLTTSEFIEKSVAKHGCHYDYSEVSYDGIRVPVRIICPHHGEFTQSPMDHLQGCGCKRCAYSKFGEERRKDFKLILARLRIIHGDKYDYSNVQYIASDKPVEVICHMHGSFFPTVYSHLNGTGCPRCYRNLNNKNGLIERFVQIHGDRYDYSFLPNGEIRHNQVISIICPRHGFFNQSKKLHLRGSGCRMCRHYRSKSETLWLNSLLIPGLKRSYQLPVLRFSVDGFDASTNTVYEFYGDFWHGNPRVFESNTKHPVLNGTFGDVYWRTINREQAIKDAGYNLVTIWEIDYLSK